MKQYYAAEGWLEDVRRAADPVFKDSADYIWTAPFTARGLKGALHITYL